MNPSVSSKESILSSIPAQYFPLTIVVGTIATIATTYTLSTSQGHTQPFPHTDITHTARFTPERYVFRCGMLFMAVVMAWNWNLLYSWLKSVQQQIDTLQKRIKLVKEHNEHNPSVLKTILMMNPPSTNVLSVVWYLGMLSAFAITISSMCITSNSDMPWTMHVIAASSFFVLCLTAQGITTYKSYKMYNQLNHIKEESNSDETLAQVSVEAQSITFMSKRSLYLKIAITGLSIGMLLINLLGSVASNEGASSSSFGNVQQPQVSLSKLSLNSHLSPMLGSSLSSNNQQANTGIEDLHLKSTISNVVEWTCTLLIIIYNITFAMDWASCKLLTSIGQISTAPTTSKILNSSHSQYQPQYGNYSLVPTSENCETSDVPTNGRTVQQQAVYVFPSNVSSKQDQNTPTSGGATVCLYPSTYTIQ